MNSTLKLIGMNTVPATYSWDQGFPNQTSLVDLSSLSAVSNNSEGIEYVGYAPYVSLLLSSTNVPRLSSVKLSRVVNFGDYYNSSENSLTIEGSADAIFSHVYIMPGLYSISLSEEEYVIAPNPQKLPSKSYSQSSPTLKKEEEPHPVNWHWKNYSNVTSRDFPSTWKDLQFQEPFKFKKPKQLKWVDTKSCLPENLESQIYWQWSNVVGTPDPLNTKNKKVTWNEAVSGGVRQKTWNSVVAGCTIDDFVLSSVFAENAALKEKYIRVLENPPTAYLSAAQPPALSARVSPLTVRLTPRFTQAGSFPIERIVWDLGDGSPLLIRRRWEDTMKLPFFYSGVLSADTNDPRNFDVIHTYERTKDTDYSFYPSITAYASSTNTSDIASTVVGPLKAEKYTGTEIVMMQNELLEGGIVYVGEVNDTAAIWRNK